MPLLRLPDPNPHAIPCKHRSTYLCRIFKLVQRSATTICALVTSRAKRFESARRSLFSAYLSQVPGIGGIMSQRWQILLEGLKAECEVRDCRPLG